MNAIVRWLFALLGCTCLSVQYISAGESPRGPRNILFVGNSLTYAGNLPAVFDAVSRSNHRDSSSYMLVSAGATLTDRLNDGSVVRALSGRKYSYVVFQERGGDFACGFGPDVCASARASIKALSDLARGSGAVPVLLGTYQGDADASLALVEAESRAAQSVGMEYVSVSGVLQKLKQANQDLKWFASDGMHPGPHLTLLDALLLYKVIYGSVPTEADISVEAPIYEFRDGFVPDVRAAGAPADARNVVARVHYKSADVRRILRGLE